ncbi:GerAB/ArcD/ProY family transporter [Paenibacillus sp. NPDC055715]
MEKGKISAYQMSLIMYPAVLATVLLSIPALVGKLAERDMWISPIWASVLGYFTVWISFRLHNQYPGATLIQMMEQIFGTLLGKFIGLLYLLFLTFNLGIMIREYTELTVGRALSLTPMPVIIGSLLIICAFTVRSGLEVIGRMAQICVIPTIFFLILLTLMISPDWDIERMLPIFANGLQPSVNGALIVQGWFSDFILLLFMLPYVKDPDKAKKWANISVLAVTLTMCLVNLTTLLVFGSITGKVVDPLMSTIAYISIADFFQSMEPVGIGIFVSGSCIKIAIFGYALSLGIAQWLKLSDYRPIVLPLYFTLVFLAQLVVKNRIELNHFLATLFPYYLTTFQTAIPLLMLIVSFFLTRKHAMRVKR